MHDNLLEKKIQHNFGYVLTYVLITALGAFYFGYHVGVLAVYSNNFTSIGIDASSQDCGYLSSVIPFAAMFGAVIAGPLSGWGRRIALIIADIIGILGPVIENMDTYSTFLAGRAICGIAVGMNSALVPLIINEVSPLKIKGPMGTMNQVMICSGILVAYILGLGPYQTVGYWRLLITIPGVIVAIRLLFNLLVYRSDTPKFYISKGLEREARAVLEKVYHEGHHLVYEALNAEQRTEDQAGKMSYGELFSEKYRRRFLVGCGLAAMQQLSGINAILFFANQILNNSQIAVVLIGVVNLAFGLVSTAIIGTVGRKSILSVGALACGVSLLLYGILDGTGIVVLQIGAVVLYIMCFAVSLGPVVWLYIPEIVPAVGVSLTTLMNWVFNFIVVQAFSFTSINYSVAENMIGFAILCFIGTLMIMTFVVETRGKTPLQIEEDYANVKRSFSDVSASSNP
jgi:sugar porter (SP) family MFS transporter